MDKKSYNPSHPTYYYNGHNTNLFFGNPGIYNINISSRTSPSSSTFHSTTESTTNIFSPRWEVAGIAPGVKMNHSVGLENQNRPLNGESFAMPSAPPNSPASSFHSSPSPFSGRPIPQGSTPIQGLMNSSSLPAGSYANKPNQ